jgi:hypothetical protein
MMNDDDINLLDKDINIINKNTAALSDAGKETDLEANTERAK